MILLTLIFLGLAFYTHWLEIPPLEVDGHLLRGLAVALGLSVVAHAWAGWAWGLILINLEQLVSPHWAVRIYLQTNLAKYIPGNIWHFLGRIRAGTEEGIPWEIAALSVLLEPLLMAAAALLCMILTLQGPYVLLQIIGFALVAVGLHPRLVNGVLQRLHPEIARIQVYPWKAFLAELVFMLLRGCGFLGVILVLHPLHASRWLQLLGAFSGAWLLGLVVPGAPGGLGVFESVLLLVLQPLIATGPLLQSLAIYRVVSLLAEVTGAALSYVRFPVLRNAE
ncbi:MAG: UPF0104 family protein [Synechococcaceae cyanobacterium SM2_3_1]|nr:UPF0104 family protein [Synechococcaceae cyanobacterium SM2_3_1]